MRPAFPPLGAPTIVEEEHQKGGGEGPYDVKYVFWPYHTEKHCHKVGGWVLTFLLKIRLDQHLLNKNASQDTISQSMRNTCG